VGETVKPVFLHVGVTAPGTIRAHCRAKEVLPAAMPGAKPPTHNALGWIQFQVPR